MTGVKAPGGRLAFPATGDRSTLGLLGREKDSALGLLEVVRDAVKDDRIC